MAVIDDDGFIRITGRIARSSKIGGEMVPHEKIEGVLTGFLEGKTHEPVESPLVAVTAVTDQKKGERLVVLHTGGEDCAEEMRQALFDAQLPNLYIPSARSFLHVDSLPLLGTGKVDLKRSKEIAKKLIATESD